MVERTFKAIDKHGAEVEFELVDANLAIENESERQYRVAYSKALADGIFPKEKLREIMKQYGMWTDEDDKEMKVVTSKMAIVQMELEIAQRSNKENSCKILAKELLQLRQRMYQLFMVQQSVFMNSAEGIAEVSKAECIMAACTLIKATKQRYWKDYKEYIRERDEDSRSTVYTQAVNVQTSLLDKTREEIEGEYPEHKYLKDIKDMMIDREVEKEVRAELERRKARAIELVDKQEQAVVKESVTEQLVKIEKPKKKKKVNK
jgi:hypothetical protein